ncbi:MAG: amidase [Thermoanaerobaculia bacterium]|nr:amidase [Thermoanaerobaculia bacterium]
MNPRHLSRRGVLAGFAAGVGAAILGAPGCSLFRGPRKTVAGDPAQLDLRDAARGVRARSLSPVDLTKACLERIDRLDRRLNAFITVTPERALADARSAESEITQGRWRGPLHGIPVALKDNVDTAGVRTTAASALFAERVPTGDAEVVRRLKASGAIVLGKLNMHELGMGSTSAISHFGPVRNPWDLDRIAGGSSGGPAAAVAAGLCFGAVGTDTGGSIRIPAACCGIVGLKPTYGVVSTEGTVPLAASLDHVGPMCRTVADTAFMFRAMTDHPVAREFDPDDPLPVSRLRVGVLSTAGTLCDKPAEDEIQAVFNTALELIRALVADVREAELPLPDLGALVEAEAYAYHAVSLEQSPERYDPRTRKAILLGKKTPDAEAARLRSELDRHRTAIRDAFARARVDLVVVPTLTQPPPALRDATDPFEFPYACTFAFNVGGLPSLSVPCGFTRSGLPIGLLVGGPPMADPRVLALAHAYESATAWHRRRPPLWNLT